MPDLERFEHRTIVARLTAVRHRWQVSIAAEGYSARFRSGQTGRARKIPVVEKLALFSTVAIALADMAKWHDMLSAQARASAVHPPCHQGERAT